MATTKELQMNFTYTNGNTGSKTLSGCPEAGIENKVDAKDTLKAYAKIVDGEATGGKYKVVEDINVD